MPDYDSELQRSLDARGYWKAMEPEGCTLVGWSYRELGIFETPSGNSLEITADHVEFFEQGERPCPNANTSYA